MYIYTDIMKQHLPFLVTCCVCWYLLVTLCFSSADANESWPAIWETDLHCGTRATNLTLYFLDSYPLGRNKSMFLHSHKLMKSVWGWDGVSGKLSMVTLSFVNLLCCSVAKDTAVPGEVPEGFSWKVWISYATQNTRNGVNGGGGTETGRDIFLLWFVLGKGNRKRKAGKFMYNPIVVIISFRVFKVIFLLVICWHSYYKFKYFSAKQKEYDIIQSDNFWMREQGPDRLTFLGLWRGEWVAPGTVSFPLYHTVSATGVDLRRHQPGLMLCVCDVDRN